MDTVAFNCTREETLLCGKIADRADALGMLTGAYDRMACLMDLDATHSNGCPLDFEKLLAFENPSFIHDMAGIANTIDRETGKLEHFFCPRSLAGPHPS